jgi:hypothetical protein
MCRCREVKHIDKLHCHRLFVRVASDYDVGSARYDYDCSDDLVNSTLLKGAFIVLNPFSLDSVCLA